MSAPALPEAFGNYALGDFVEVVAPAAINWVPQTAGWAWLGVALLALLLRYGWQYVRRWHRNRYRREAQVRLRRLAKTANHDAWLIELNKLLKLTALATFSREQVARLSGQAWVDFLERQCPTPTFSAQQRQLLAVGTYRHATLSDETRQQLVAASIDWIRMHEAPAHV